MNRLKFLHRCLLLLALVSLITSCLSRQVDLAVTPSPQKQLTPIPTSNPTLIPSGTPSAAIPSTESMTPTALPNTLLALTPSPAAPALNLDAFASVLKEFPLFPGTQWTYMDTEYDPAPNDPTQIIQAVYEITDMVVEAQIAASNYMARVQRKVRQMSADPAWSDQNHNPPASGDIVYTLQTDQVFSKNLISTAPMLEFQFPLEVGAQWCPNPLTTPYSDPTTPTEVPCAYGIGMRIVRSAGSFQSPAGTFPTCFLLDDVYNGGDTYQTFCEGVGIVEQKFDHAGSRFGFSKVLTGFIAGTAPILTPAPTTSASLTDEQVLAKALLNTDQQAYCSWQILGQAGDMLGAWVLCELQVEPYSAGSVPVVIHLNSAGHYGQVEIPRDGNDYTTDVQRLFPLDIQAKILGNNFDLKSLEQGIARRKAGEFTVPYIIPGEEFVPWDCSWVNEPVQDVPGLGASSLSGWNRVTLPEAGFTLDVPQDWRVVQFRQSSRVCGNIDGDPHFLKLQTPDGRYQLTIGFRRPDQLVNITPTFTWFGDFVEAGQVSFFGNEIPATRRVYQGRDMAVFYNGSNEFAVGGNVFTLLLAITNDPKNNERIPQDVENQVEQILASFRPYPSTSSNLTTTPAPTLPAAQPLTLLSQRGGTARGVALSGNTAYVGIGSRLTAVDVSDPASPHLLAQSPALPGAVSGVLLFPATPKDTGAVVSAGRYIEVFNVTRAENLLDQSVWIDKVSLPGTINTMVVDRVNWKLYVGGSIYQSSDPNTGPVNSGYLAVVNLYAGIQLGQVLPLAGSVQSLALAKSMLYAAHTGAQGLIAITGIPLVSATQLGQPAALTIPAVPAVSFSIQAVGDRLYIDSFDTLVALDISDPTALKEQWRSHLGMLAYGFIVQPGHIDAMGLAPVGDYALQQNRITPDEAVRTDPQVTSASDVACVGARIYLARDGLEIFDTHDPQKARPLGAYQPPLLVTIAHVAQGDLVYTLDTDSFKHNWSQFLHVLRLPDLKIVSEYHFKGFDDAPGWEYFYSMEIEGDRLYLFDYHQGTWVFDLSNPLKPAFLNRPAYLNDGLSAATSGTLGHRRLVFKANPVENSATLVAYDVTDLNTITALSSLDLKDETPQRLAWSGGLLYTVTQVVSAGGNGFSYAFEVFSLENDTLKLQSRTPLAGDSHLAARGSLVALASPQGMVILSTSDPSVPQVLSLTPLAGSGTILAFLDNYHLLVALQGSSSQLLTFDLADPVKPRLLSTVDVPPAGQIMVSSPYIILSSSSEGIEVLK